MTRNEAAPIHSPPIASRDCATGGSRYAGSEGKQRDVTRVGDGGEQETSEGTQLKGGSKVRSTPPILKRLGHPDHSSPKTDRIRLRERAEKIGGTGRTQEALQSERGVKQAL